MRAQWAAAAPTLLAGLAPLVFFSVSTNLARGEDVPRGEGHPLGLDHGNDLALDVAVHDVPRALVDDERRLARLAGVHVRLRDDPRRGVGDTLQTN